MLPKPFEIGLPAKFVSWRPNQPQAIQDGLDSKKRFVGQVQRAGAGKSVTAVSQALISRSRTVILTSTLALQDQYMEDFSEIGMVKMMGKSNYSCESDPGRSCEEGSIARCLYKSSSMCPHTYAKSECMNSNLIVMNYACWIMGNKYSTGWGQVDLLVLDEGHMAASELAKAVQVRISTNEIVDMLKADLPDNVEDMESWKSWANTYFVLAEEKVKLLKDQIEKGKGGATAIKQYKHFNNLSRKLAEIASCKAADWVVDNWNHGYQFDPLNPATQAEKYLFKGAAKVIIVSGTIRPRSIEMLGIDPEDFDFFDYPAQIDIERSPLICIPTVRVWRGSEPWEYRKLVRRIDEIFEKRGDRKGICHSVSYKLRDIIVSYSQYSKFFVMNNPQEGQSTAATIERFKAMAAPALLVSPSVTTGYDFPYDTCRYQIIAKLPWPDGRSKVEQARNKVDPKREAYQTMMSLAQAFGRGDRAEDDFQEVFVLDDAVEKFLFRNRDLAPSWLLPYLQRQSNVPPAPEID